MFSLPSTDEVHDLNAVSVREHQTVIRIAPDDCAIVFHGNPPLAESEPRDEFGYRHALVQRVRFAIDDHLHAKNIVISGYLYNVGTIW